MNGKMWQKFMNLLEVEKMNKDTFIKNLKETLENTNKLTSHETYRICDYFTEMIDDRVEEGLLEEDVFKSLGTLDEISKNVLEDIENTSILAKTDSKLINTTDKTKKEKVFNEIFRDIILKTKNEAVKIYVSPDEDIHLIYAEDDYEEYNINVDDKKIMIDKVVKKFRFFGFRKTRDFEIYLPENYNANLDLSTSNSNISCKHVSFNEGEFNTSNSNISMELISARRARSKTSNSNIKIENCSFNEAIYVITSNSKVKLENVNTIDIAVKTSNGKIEAENINAKGELIFKTTNANIIFENIVGYNMELMSSNGKLEGSINDSLENFSIDAKTSNANSNLNFTSDKERKLIAKTSNGKINIQFLGGDKNYDN